VHFEIFFKPLLGFAMSAFLQLKVPALLDEFICGLTELQLVRLSHVDFSLGNGTCIYSFRIFLMFL
jgi:hypothetical protein